MHDIEQVKVKEPGLAIFAIIQPYGPTEPNLNKSWKPGDIEKIE